jgi:hypothetical protein
MLAAAPLHRTFSPSLSEARSRRLRLRVCVRVGVRVTLSLTRLLFLSADEIVRCGWGCRKGVAARLAGFAFDAGVFEGCEALATAAVAEFLLHELGVIFRRPVRACCGCPGAHGPDVSDGLGGNAESFRQTYGKAVATSRCLPLLGIVDEHRGFRRDGTHAGGLHVPRSQVNAPALASVAAALAVIVVGHPSCTALASVNEAVIALHHPCAALVCVGAAQAAMSVSAIHMQLRMVDLL